MNTKIRGWGNSYGVLLSKQTLTDSGFELNDEAEVIALKDEIIIKKPKIIDWTKAFPKTFSTNGWKFDREVLNER